MAVVVGVEGAEHEAVVGGVQTWQRAERGREVLADETVHGPEGVEGVAGGEERGVASENRLRGERGAGVERGAGHGVERGAGHGVQRRPRVACRRRSKEIVLHDILEIGQREIVSSGNYGKRSRAQPTRLHGVFAVAEHTSERMA